MRRKKRNSVGATLSDTIPPAVQERLRRAAEFDAAKRAREKAERKARQKEKRP